MDKVKSFIKKEAMLVVSVIAAVISLFITPPSKALLTAIDWKTLATLFMMLTVLEGFKKENIFRPLLQLCGKMKNMTGLSFFLVFSVFLSSMFVTNDVSLIIFVPLTIMLFRAADEEKYILPVITFENIAAIRGSLLTPFGSPQNLFLFGKSDMNVGSFLLMMLPLFAMSAILLGIFILFLYRNHKRELTISSDITKPRDEKRKGKRITYLILFALIIFTIVSRTSLWPYITAIVLLSVLVTDRQVPAKTDYVLLLTFLCFFVFSSSLTSNESISAFLSKIVAGREYAVAILLSQVISNVPASIVLYPFSTNLKALIYGLDTAGLCSLIGSLASVINYRLYVREYPKNGKKFVLVFTGLSLLFFAFVVLPGYFISK